MQSDWGLAEFERSFISNSRSESGAPGSRLRRNLACQGEVLGLSAASIGESGFASGYAGTAFVLVQGRERRLVTPTGFEPVLPA
jgi:hypothetical protein